MYIQYLYNMRRGHLAHRNIMEECEPIGALPKERCGDGARLTATLARLNSLIVVRGPAKLDENREVQSWHRPSDRELVVS